MGSFAQNFIKSYQAGKQGVREEEKFAQEKKDRDLQIKMLKLQNELQQRSMEQAQSKMEFDFMQGKQGRPASAPAMQGQTVAPQGAPSGASDLVKKIIEAAQAQGTGAMPIQGAESRGELRHDPMNISMPGMPSGYEELGIRGTQDRNLEARPQTQGEVSQQALSQLLNTGQVQAIIEGLKERAKAPYAKPVAVPYGGKLVNPGTGETVATGEDRPLAVSAQKDQDILGAEAARLGIKPGDLTATQRSTARKKYDLDVARAKSELGLDPNQTGDTPIDESSKSILAQTGLSFQAFMVLTGKSSQLSRDKATRNKAYAEAGQWANKRGVDISTMAQQFQTYNEVLGSNIARLNRTRIMEDELEGTIENLQGVVEEKDLGKLRFGNIAKIWAGQEVNDDLAQQYAMHLFQLRNELAAYGAATQGRSGNEITITDQREAELTIKNGIAKGSLNGLATAVKNSTEKMGVVMQRSVESARKGVWDLFGVGDKYKGKDEASGAGPKTAEEYKKKYGIK